MKRFFIKFFLHGIVCLTISLLVVYGIYVKETGHTRPDFSEIPANFISNSVCFNSKLDHAKSQRTLLNTDCLILGSSISLNNIDAELVSNKNKLTTYNLSSWGLKPLQSYQFLKSLNDNIKPKYLIIAFNNADFGKDNKEIDYVKINDYLFNNSAINRLSSYLANFTIQSFMSDWSMRSNFAGRDNVYESLRFDEHGSILLNAQNFQYSPAIQPLTYRDTTGYNHFKAGIDSISHYCAERQIRLLLIYSPWKKDVLTSNKIAQNAIISEQLRKDYKDDFIDLSSFPIPTKYYVDGGHLYKNGATLMTTEINKYLH